MFSRAGFTNVAINFEFGAKARQRFYIKLSQMLENGVALDTALRQLQESGGVSKGSALPLLFGRIRNQVANGRNFGQSLSQYVPSTEAILLETGADSGNLINALKTAADVVASQNRVRNAIINNSAYPLLLILMLIAALVLSTYVVIPTFTEILPVEEWQGSSAVVARSSIVLRDYGILILGVLLATLFVVFMSLPRWTGKGRIYFEGIFPWNLYRMWQGSSFLLSVVALMRAGVKLDEVSLNKISKNAEPYLLQRISAIKRNILSGENLGEALHLSGYKFPDEELISDLRIYARLRGFEDNIERITKTWSEDLIEKVQVIMKAVNTVVLFLIAIVIGFMISSLYSVVQQIQSTT